MKTSQSDDEIIKTAVECEVHQFLAQRQNPKRGYVLGYDDVEELIRQCLQHSYDQMYLFNPKRAKLKTFIAAITPNYLKDLVDKHGGILQKTIVPMTDEHERTYAETPQASTADEELSLAKQEIVRRTIQRLPKEARQFFEDFIKLEKLEQKKSSSKKKHKQKKKNTVLNALRKRYKLWPRQFYELLWPKVLDQFNDAFYVECKDDPDILAWFLRKFLEGQRREGNKKQFINNNKKKGN